MDIAVTTSIVIVKANRLSERQQRLGRLSIHFKIINKQCLREAPQDQYEFSACRTFLVGPLATVRLPIRGRRALGDAITVTHTFNSPPWQRP